MSISYEDFEFLKRSSLNCSRKTNASHGGCINDVDMELIIGLCCEKLLNLVWCISTVPSFVYKDREYQISNRMFSINLNVRESIDDQLGLIFEILARQLGNKRLVIYQIDAGIGLNVVGEHVVSISYVII